MKKQILFLTIFMSCNLFAQKNVAIADQIGGVYIFTDSTPLGQYEVLGDVTFGGSGSSAFVSMPNGMGGSNMIISGLETPQYTSIRNGLVANAVMANRAVEGVLIQITKEGEGRATMIKFKEDEDKSKCKVSRQQGLYVFCDCKPFQDYDKLGEIVGAGGLSTLYGDLRNRLIKKVLRKYKTADGIIIHLVEEVIQLIREDIRAPRYAYYRYENPEKAMENAIAKQFAELYGKHNVSQQYSVGGFLSLKCDIDLFDNKCCGIELKLSKNLKNSAIAMQRVIGQVVYYSRRCYQKSGMILLVVGTEKELDPKLDELKKFIEEFPNTYFVYKQVN